MPTPTLGQIRALPTGGFLRHGKLNDYQNSVGQQAPSGQNWTFDGANNPTLQKNDSILKTMVLPAALGAGAAFAGPLAGLLGGGGAAAGAGGLASTGGIGVGMGSSVLPGMGLAAGSTGIMGALGKYGPMLGRLGEVASGAAKGRADGRMAEGDYNLRRDALEGRNASANVDADSTRIKQAILLSLLGGSQDAQVTPPAHIASHMPQLSGGVKPSAIQGREQIVQAARQRILDSLFSGQHMPGLTDAPQGNGLDSILSMLGLGTGLLGAVRGPQQSPTPAPPAQQRTR